MPKLTLKAIRYGRILIIEKLWFKKKTLPQNQYEGKIHIPHKRPKTEKELIWEWD